MKRIYCLCVMVLLMSSQQANAQQSLTLDAAILRALSESIAFKKATTALETNQWRYKDYKSYLKPQVGLTGNLPVYSKESTPIAQEDGTVKFRTINQSQNDLRLSVEQGIAATGGRLLLSSELGRADNFDPLSKTYASSPVIIGYEQPISGFNELKWAKRLEPLRYKEGVKEYVEERENISLQTTQFFFDWVMAQINLQMAESNLKTADTILSIGTEKYRLGQISKNELLQLQLAAVHAKKAVSNALLEIQSASLRLRSYAGLGEHETFALRLPETVADYTIDIEAATALALKNSQRAVEMERRLLEAMQFSNRTKKETGLNANLSFRYGLTDVGENFTDAYKDVQDLQTFSLTFAMPIIDWGRQQAKRRTADADLKLAQYSIVQEKENLRQQIATVIRRFEMLQDLVVYTKSADDISSDRFEIAKKRYLLGDIEITDLNIARDEKDTGKRDYIEALRGYWESYFLIRILTLYDFENQQALAL